MTTRQCAALLLTRRCWRYSAIGTLLGRIPKLLSRTTTVSTFCCNHSGFVRKTGPPGRLTPHIRCPLYFFAGVLSCALAARGSAPSCKVALLTNDKNLLAKALINGAGLRLCPTALVFVFVCRSLNTLLDCTRPYVAPKASIVVLISDALRFSAQRPWTGQPFRLPHKGSNVCGKRSPSHRRCH